MQNIWNHKTLGMPKFIEKKFGKHMQNVWSHKTLGTSKFLIMKPMINSEKIFAKHQEEYWSHVGMLLYLVKHLNFDLANMIRELSKLLMVQTLLPTRIS